VGEAVRQLLAEGVDGLFGALDRGVGRLPGGALLLRKIAAGINRFSPR
jgi:hypothetical protein